MKKSTVITGLDIGSSKICAVSGEVGSDGACSLLGVTTVPSRGVERGTVTDLNSAVESVSRALERLEERTARKIEDIYVNVSGRSIMAQKARGMVSLSMSGREITEEDMRRCVNVASTMRLPFESEIVHKITHSYLIDDQTESRNPLGLYGSRLAVEIYVITAGLNHIQNLHKVINNCGYEVKEAVFSALADTYSLFDDEERGADVALVDIGSSLTEIALCEEGVVRYVEVVPAGASDIQGRLDKCPPFDSIVDRVRKALDDSEGRGRGKGFRARSVIVAGGGSLMDGAVEAFESALGIPARPGVVKHLLGNASSADSIIATTAMGLVRYGFERQTPGVRIRPKNLVKRLSSTVVDIFNNYF